MYLVSIFFIVELKSLPRLQEGYEEAANGNWSVTQDNCHYLSKCLSKRNVRRDD